MEWYKKAFQKDYLKIYSHKTDFEAKKELEILLSSISLKSKSKILDLCCGNGRHSRWIEKQGFQVTGVDLSTALLQEAIRLSPAQILYLSCDMRSLPFTSEFDLIIQLFTSFGYFSNDEENNLVLKNVYKSLKMNGYYILDYLNPNYIKKNIIPYSKSSKGNVEIFEHRQIKNNFIIKDIIIEEFGQIRKYQEKVKLYPFVKLKRMLEAINFDINLVYGDYDGSIFNEHCSKRMIFICKK
ncbi:class I SAM-dependent methyltransferase [Bacillus mycoides]|uniref:class I SAM-dependent methyltransferase n=1 Tax=Bacillus mycoides TaxID=1405 RepID=UPI003D65719A